MKRTLKQCLDEFTELKEAIFGPHNFVEVEDNPAQRRYEQLLGLFYPEFRGKIWIDPTTTRTPIDIAITTEKPGIVTLYTPGQLFNFCNQQQNDKNNFINFADEDQAIDYLQTHCNNLKVIEI